MQSCGRGTPTTPQHEFLSLVFRASGRKRGFHGRSSQNACWIDTRPPQGLGAARGLQAHPILPGLVLGETKDGGNSESFLE